jgi:two-component system chemotaxis response regulator CheY
MPDVLILTNQSKDLEFLPQLATAEGFRNKITTEISAAQKWTAALKFDLLVIHEEFGDKAIEQLSNALWSTNSGAQVSVYTSSEIDQIEASKKRWSMGVLGAEYFCGKDVFRSLALTLRKISQRSQRSGAKFKVMVVEDLEAARDIICSFVEHLEYSLVKGFASGQEAFDALLADPSEYSCVITDVNMPGMTGWELTERIRSNAKLKHLPVIALTAYGSPDVLLKCFKAGASGFLVKPPSKLNLSRELSRAKRIILNAEDPRLVQPQDVELMRSVLEDKGYI